MRAVALCLHAELVRFVAAADCLPGAIPAGERQNIIVKGKSLPVGVWRLDWESASIVTHLIKILASEHLGYNVAITNKSSSSLNGGLAAATCADPLNAQEPQCDRDDSYVPPTHMVLEWWQSSFQYSRQWFAENNPKRMPILLGYMGYRGREGMNVKTNTVMSALAREGSHMDYYGWYNASWFQQWDYFDNISAVPSSRLKQCTDIGLVCGGEKARLSREFNDTAGFEVRRGDTCIVCPDGRWWLSPACRAQPSRCIPLLTAGTGWKFDDFLEKILAHNMPFALAVASAYSDYIFIFKEYNILSYNWKPGVHHGQLKSSELTFPRHNASAYKERIQKSMSADSMLERLAWQGLERAAPDVFFLGVHIEVTTTDMNNMLDMFLDMGDTANVSCKWLQDNKELWETWLPEYDATRCSVGHGMVSGAGVFTANRTQAIKCTPCPAGFQSRMLLAATGTTYICEQCEAGNIQPMWGADHCASCDAGKYQNQSGQSQCFHCPRGRFAGTPGRPECQECPEGTTTEGIGFASEVDCGCPPDTCLAKGSSRCIECGEGASCRGFQSAPEASYGFHLREVGLDGLSIYKCFGDMRHCPGGLVDTCADGREGIACAACKSRMAPSGDGTCQPCASSDKGLFAFAVVIFILALAGAYIKTSMSDAERQSQPLILIVLMSAQIVSVAQLLGVSHKLSVAWRPPISHLLSVARIFSFDLKVFRIDCLGALSVLNIYALTVMVAPIGLTYIGMLHVFKVLLLNHGNFSDQKHAVLGTAGLLLMTFFITISTSIMSPFQCQQHPNHEWTLLQYENQLCWQGGDHTIMIMMGTSALSMPISFVSLVTYLLYVFPGKMRDGDVHFLNTYAFLFLRVKPTTRWFMLIYLLRNLLIAIVPAIPSPFWQVIFMEVLFSSTIASIAYVQPWRLQVANFMEVLMSMCLLLLMCVAAFFVDDHDVEGVAIVGFVVVLISVVAFPLYIASMLFRRMFGRKSFHFFLCHHKAAAGTFARLLKLVLLEQKGIRGGVFIDSDNLVDLEELFNCVAIEVDILVVLATAEIFFRPWCLGELATAHVGKATIVPIYFADFVLPESDFISTIDSRVDVTVLTENSVSLHNVRIALAGFGSHKHIKVPKQFEAGYVKSLAQQLVQSSYTAPAKDGDSGHEPAMQSQQCSIDSHNAWQVILVDSMNTEAVAAGMVMVHLLRRLSAGRATAFPILYDSLSCKAGTGVQQPSGISALILMCTGNCFQHAHYLQSIVWAMDVGVMKVLPVAVADAFKFPTDSFYNRLAMNTARLCEIVGAEVVPELLTKYVEFIFKKIAVPFSTMSSSDVLDSQAHMVWTRLGGANQASNKRMDSKEDLRRKKPASMIMDRSTSHLSSIDDGDNIWVVPIAHQKAVEAIIAVPLNGELFALPKMLALEDDGPAPAMNHITQRMPGRMLQADNKESAQTCRESMASRFLNQLDLGHGEAISREEWLSAAANAFDNLASSKRGVKYEDIRDDLRGGCSDFVQDDDAFRCRL